MNCISPINLKNPRFGHLKPNSTEPEPRFLEVPCGKCAACLMSRRRDWSLRLSKEAKTAYYSLFVTLTYSDEFLPADGVNKEDVQAFLARLRDRLRKKYEITVRYYIVSEYGPETFRPHYHGLFFFNGYVPDASDILSSWGKGFCYLGTVESRTIQYVSSYHITKGGFPRGFNKPFCLMSRRPGIGDSYIRDRSVIRYHLPRISGFDSKPVFSVPVEGGIHCHMPRFYRDKLFTKKELEDYRRELQIKQETILYGVDKRDFTDMRDYYRVVDSRIKAYLRYFDKMRLRNKKL